MVWGPQWRGLYTTLACMKIGINTFLPSVPWDLKEIDLTGSCKQLLNFLMELYNVMILLYFFKSTDFYYLEIIASLFL